MRSGLTLAGVTLINPFSNGEEAPAGESIGMIGPQAGYTPHVGTLISMMDFMRWQVLSSVEGLSMEQLDYLLDDKANTIGALLMHLAATERFYQLNTFDGIPFGEFPMDMMERWGPAMELGDEGREQIRGNELSYYLGTLNEVRTETKNRLKVLNDDWLMEDRGAFFDNKPTNNYAKWFHVVEHESNHNGQIKLLKNRFEGQD